MGSITVPATSMVISSTSGSPVNPTNVGGAGSYVGAINDSSDTTYLQYGAGSVGVEPRLYIQFDNVRTSVPAGARIYGLAVSHRQAFNPGGDRYFWPFRMWASSFPSYLYYFSYGIGTLTKDATFRTFQSVTVAKTNTGGVFYWDSLIETSSVDIVVDMPLWGSFDGTAGAVGLAEVDLIVYYDEQPTVSSVAVSSTGVSNPDITWTYADPEGSVQTQYDIVVLPSATIDSTGKTPGTTGFDPTTSAVASIWEAYRVSSSATSATVANPLDNGDTYYAYVRVYQGDVNGNPFYSDWDYVTWTTSFTPPPTPEVWVVVDSDTGRARLAIGDAYTTDIYEAQNTSFALERSIDGGTAYTAMASGASSLWGLRQYSGMSTTQYAYLPDSTALSVTGDIRLEGYGLRPTDLSSDCTILYKDGSYALKVLSTGYVQVYWTDGSNTQTVNSTTKITDLGLSFPQDAIHVRADVTVAASYSVTFYYSTSTSTTPGSTEWVQLGATVTGSTSATSIVDSSNGLRIGSYWSGGVPTQRFYGWMSGFSVYNGLTASDLSEQVLFINIAPGYFSPSATYSSTYTGATLTMAAISTSYGLSYDDPEILEGTATYYRGRGWGPTAAESDLYSAYSSAVSATLTLTNWLLKAYHTAVAVEIDLMPNSLDLQRPKERAVYKPLGTNRYVVISDGTRGLQGTLKIEVTTQAARDALQAVYDADDAVVLQSPFFDWNVGKTFAILDWKQKKADPAGQYWQIDLDVVEIEVAA